MFYYMLIITTLLALNNKFCTSIPLFIGMYYAIPSKNVPM